MRAGTTALRIGIPLLFVSTVGILALTLGRPEIFGEAHAARCYLCDPITAPDVVRNLALFLPLGAGLLLVGARPWQALLLASALSAGIELAQLWIPGRESSAGDLLCNTLGAALGIVLAQRRDAWVHPAPRAAAWLSLAAACGAAGLIAFSSWLLSPTYTPVAWYAGWVPELGYLGLYRGYILDARIGDVPLPGGRLRDTDAVRELLRAGAPLRVRAIAGPDPERLSPLLTIHDAERREMVILGAEGDDLIYRQRTHGADLRLEQPSIRIPGALANLVPGTPLAIEVTRRGDRVCITINDVVRCGLGFSAGRAWALLFRIRDAAWIVRRALDGLWIAGLALPVAFWCRSRAPALLALAVLAASVSALPPALGLLAPRFAEGVGSVLGLLLGFGLQRLAQARA